MKPVKTPPDVTTPIKCLQVIDSLGAGGTEKMVLLLAKESARHGLPFAVASLENDAGSDIAHEIRAENGRVFNFPSGKLLDLKRILAIRELIRREGFDLVHSYLTYGNIVGCLAGFLAGVPVIGSLRNLGDSPVYYSAGRSAIETLCLNLLARRVMCNGYAVAKVHARRIRMRPISVIPNATPLPDPISAGERAALQRELSGNESRPIIISAGRLISVKGFANLIKSIRLVCEKIPNVQLVIAGEGMERAGLEKLVSDLCLTSQVNLTGYRADVSRLLQAADVYVNASSAEGMSVAVLEAMAAGLPVAATDVGDAARVVASGTGVIIPSNEPALIAGALLPLLADEGQRRKMGRAARERIALEYSPEAWFQKMMDLYSEVTEGPGQ